MMVSTERRISVLERMKLSAMVVVMVASRWALTPLPRPSDRTARLRFSDSRVSIRQSSPQAFWPVLVNWRHSISTKNSGFIGFGLRRLRRAVGSGDLFEQNFGFGDVFAEEARDFLNGQDVFADHFFGFFGDLFAAEFGTGHILNHRAGGLARRDGENAEVDDPLVYHLIEFFDFTAVGEHAFKEIGEINQSGEFNAGEAAEAVVDGQRVVVEHFGEMAVGFEDIEIFIDDDHARGNVLDQRVAGAFKIPAQEVVAHRALRLAGDQGAGEFPAAVVTAGAAVEFVGFVEFADAGERFQQRRFVGRRRCGRRREIAPADIHRHVAAETAAVAADPAGGEQRGGVGGVFGHGRTVDAAAGTGQRFDEKLARRQRRGGEFGQHGTELGQAGNGNVTDWASDIAQGVVHAAFDGVDAAFFGRAEDERRLVGRIDFDVALSQQRGQRRKGDGEIKYAGIGVGLGFLGGAGTEENDPDAVAVGLAQEFGMSHHRRIEGYDRRSPLGQVFADIIDRRRTGAGNMDAVGTGFQEVPGGGAYQLRAVGGFADAGETQLAERRRQRREGNAGEVTHETRRD
ncbi:hypothetical protein SDC9_76923 [bioreactor metagenome]|uniref:Uncharacterized protein n=1 Tax=bioreactor metagenome TaxID=1076179 RepID=A0A644YP55_9ZZZZ